MKASELGDRLLPARELPPIKLLEGEEFMLRPNGFGLALLIIMLLAKVLLLLKLFKPKWLAFWLLFWLLLNLFIRPPPPPPKLPKLFIIEFELLLLLLLLKLAKFFVRLLPLFEKLLPIELTLGKVAPICRPLGVGFDDDEEATPTVELVELVVPKLPNEKLPRPKLLLLLLLLLLLVELNTPALLAAEPPFTPFDALDTFRLTDELFRPLAFRPLGVMLLGWLATFRLLVGLGPKPSADCCCCCC